MENYEYNVVEKSLTQDFMIKWVWQPFVNILPRGVTPNMLTYAGVAFVITMVLGVYMLALGQKWGLLVTAISTFLYMLCDNSDGILARSTGQTSKLGEFLDHWLDSISFVLVNACIAFCLGFEGEIFFIYIATMTLAFYVTMWEHHYTGVFVSGHLGSNESMLIYIIIYTILFFLPDTSWLVYNGEYNIAFFLLAMAILGSCFTTIGCLVRVKKQFIDIILFIAAMLAVGLWSFYQMLDITFIVAFIVAINMIFCGKLVKSHLAKLPSPYRYPLFIIIIPIAFSFPFFPFFAPYNLYFVYSSLIIMYVAGLSDGISCIYKLTR
ncbi:CDP-alcohol phosphatidyltransferase family protein [Candidatus Uabimicrobium sp. HlEnr_7]|uniref:CDP-alcohol phosphatidyltransferase family protein n=1 Tax=Candidatus Uabimicrobium helgolandensis TaxID=3095367 RepID=UPI0035576D48